MDLSPFGKGAAERARARACKTGMKVCELASQRKREFRLTSFQIGMGMSLLSSLLEDVQGTVKAFGMPPLRGNDVAVTNPASSLAR